MRLFAADEAATDNIGRRIAAHLQPGDLVLLDGDLGTGKTALARAIIRCLAGDAELEVPSPTFLLVLPYVAEDSSVLHADLYRLGDAADIEELGLFDDDKAVVLVEWPDRAPDLASKADLIVKLELPGDGNGRRFDLTTPRGADRLQALAESLSEFAV